MEEGKGEKMRRNLREQGGRKSVGGDKGENDGEKSNSTTVINSSPVIPNLVS